MATLIPSLNSCLGRMTSGEKRFAYRLEKLLEDDYLCWYDVTVGVKRRRPDFLVLNPQRGLLALEVKDWKIGSIRGIDPITIEAEFNGQIVKDVNPLLKARDFINVTIDLLKRDPLLLQAPDSRQGSLFEAPELADALPVPDLIRVMDLQQEQLARSLGEGHRVIHGVAGSGKTMILGYRAEYLAKAAGKPVLVLCFNRALAQKLAGWMEHKGLSQRVTVRTLHGWCSDMVKTYQLNRPARGDAQFAQLVQEVIDGVNRGQVPAAQYSAVLIDEGHDFEPEWLRLVVQMVDPESNSLLLMYDSAQDIYQKAKKRRFSFASVGVKAQGRTTILRLNYRNTAEVLAVAHEFARELLTAEEADEDGVPLISPQSAGRHGVAPEFIRLPSFPAEVACIADKLRASQAEGSSWRDMAVLTYRNDQAKAVVSLLTQAGIPAQAGLIQPGSAEVDGVSVLTLHASKGLEFPIVAIPGLGDLPYASHDANEQARVLYVGMTRAMNRLWLTSSKESDFSDKAERSCEKLAA